MKLQANRSGVRESKEYINHIDILNVVDVVEEDTFVHVEAIRNLQCRCNRLTFKRVLKFGLKLSLNEVGI